MCSKTSSSPLCECSAPIVLCWTWMPRTPLRRLFATIGRSWSMRLLCDILDDVGGRMKVEDEYLDVLQNIEFAIMRVFRADRSLLDLDAKDDRRGTLA